MGSLHFRVTIISNGQTPHGCAISVLSLAKIASLLAVGYYFYNNSTEKCRIDYTRHNIIILLFLLHKYK